eukprot:TRINITY_DN20900_c0_g1_i8.p1 TRINITY_DN20900_c0_g1~~TRINITY_DN20900_c0_g1_i8.p1  ORF type:complete len:169 (-),score=51.48 TRINITY_DN20900_c0_g1_i8:11-454(-)
MDAEVKRKEEEWKTKESYHKDEIEKMTAKLGAQSQSSQREAIELDVKLKMEQTKSQDLALQLADRKAFILALDTKLKEKDRQMEQREEEWKKESQEFREKASLLTQESRKHERNWDAATQKESELRKEIGRAVQQECRDRSRMPSSA